MFCPKCGNNIIQGSRFCNKCGNQVPVMPVQTNVSQQVPINTPQQKSVYVPQPNFTNTAASLVSKEQKGVSMLFAIVSAVLCFMALCGYYAGFSLCFRLTLRTLRSILGFYFIFETVSYISGIGSSFLSMKNPAFTLIPGGLIFVTLCSRVYKYIYYVNMTAAPDYTRQTIRRQFIPLGAEMIILIAAFIVFMLSVINRNRKGTVLSLVSAGLFVNLSLAALIILAAPVLHYAKYISDYKMVLRAYTENVVSFSRILLYGSFVSQSFGVFVRNRSCSE